MDMTEEELIKAIENLTKALESSKHKETII